MVSETVPMTVLLFPEELGVEYVHEGHVHGHGHRGRHDSEMSE
jgi:hypothetical protein